MRHLINKIVKSLAYLVAAFVILLAVAVGLFRLLLPRLPEYQDEIKGWANSAIGMEVEFADMIARWRLSGPELTFQDAELTVYDAETSLLTAKEVSVGVSLMRLLRDRELVVDRIQILADEFLIVDIDGPGLLEEADEIEYADRVEDSHIHQGARIVEGFPIHAHHQLIDDECSQLVS